MKYRQWARFGHDHGFLTPVPDFKKSQTIKSRMKTRIEVFTDATRAGIRPLRQTVSGTALPWVSHAWERDCQQLYLEELSLNIILKYHVTLKISGTKLNLSLLWSRSSTAVPSARAQICVTLEMMLTVNSWLGGLRSKLFPIYFVQSIQVGQR